MHFVNHWVATLTLIAMPAFTLINMPTTQLKSYQQRMTSC
jgi:hypothetical protein